VLERVFKTFCAMCAALLAAAGGRLGEIAIRASDPGRRRTWHVVTLEDV